MYDTYSQLLLPIINRAKSFLQDDMNIAVINDESKIVDSEHVTLKKNTVLIGTGGSVQVIITLGFDNEVLDKLVEEFCYGEAYEGDELIEMQESVACETSNIIIGNALKNPVDDTLINITPPILIHEAKSLAKYKNSMILESKINTIAGEVQLTAIGPKELFSDKIDFKEI